MEFGKTFLLRVLLRAVAGGKSLIADVGAKVDAANLSAARSR